VQNTAADPHSKTTAEAKLKPRKERERKTSSRTQICDQEILSSIFFFIITLPRNSNKETMAESGAATEW
jgi:hypothetical protein